MDKIHMNYTNKHIKKCSICLVIGKFKPRPQRHMSYSFNWQYFKTLKIPVDGYYRIHRIVYSSLVRGKQIHMLEKSAWRHLLKLSFHKAK